MAEVPVTHSRSTVAWLIVVAVVAILAVYLTARHYRTAVSPMMVGACDISPVHMRVHVLAKDQTDPERVILYTHDTIEWDAGPGVKGFTLDFRGKQPLLDHTGNPNSMFSWKQGDPLAYGTAVKPATPIECYTYSVTVTTETGTKTADPRIIIVGTP